jgi:hypothetical protein
MAMFHRGARVCLFAGAILLASAGVVRAEDEGLTGTWYGADGITHSVRQDGRDVWWVAKSGDGGKSFVAVFHGKLTGNHLTGQFADVPEGENRASGALKAKLVLKDGKAVAIEGELFFPKDDTPRAWSISRTKPEK